MKRLGALLALAGALSAQAEVKLNSIFMDHMVLQRDIPAKVYGTADAGETVTVAFAGQEKTVQAGIDGYWMVALKKMKANAKPQVLTVSGPDNRIKLKDVLVGDVWLCTGQSNMAGTIDNYITYKDGMFEEFRKVPGDYKNEMIRLFIVNPGSEDEPQNDLGVGQGWAVCDPESALEFSCTGYFFGKALQPEVGIPVGLVKSCFGGTSVSSWLPMDVMQQNPVTAKVYVEEYEQELKAYPKAKESYDAQLKAWRETKKGKKPKEPMGPEHPKRLAAMYNAMIHPLHNFAVKGAIWYQGENEANRSLMTEYQTIFPLLITTWRERWEQGDFPFVFAQLASYKKLAEEPTDTNWARQRESQLITMKKVNNTGMAVGIDAGLTKNIHPPYKELVGNRLAEQVLELAYGKKGVAQGPLYKSMKVKDGKAVLSFDHVGGGLMAKGRLADPYFEKVQLSADELKGFSVAGEDQVFHWAKAEVKGDTVEVSCPEVPNPVAVRYAWADFPLCNLYNQEGFAASPFRTDNWPQLASGQRRKR